MNADQGWKIEFEDGAIMNLDRAEHIKEAAAVMSQMVDMLAIRSFPTPVSYTHLDVYKRQVLIIWSCKVPMSEAVYIKGALNNGM